MSNCFLVFISNTDYLGLIPKVCYSTIANWSEKDQKGIKDLITDFGYLFAFGDLDLEKTSVISSLWASTVVLV